jgi:hypothetical protein
MKKPKMQKATAQEKALTKMGIDTWNGYVSDFMPAEAEMARRAEFTASEKAAAKGMASADTAAAFKGLNRDTIKTQSMVGADESSGRTKFAIAGNAEAEGKAKGLSAAAASVTGEIQSDYDQLGVMATGRDVAFSSMADMAAGARRATGLALAASQAKFAKNEALVNAAGVVAGAGVRRYQLNKDAAAKKAKESQTFKDAIHHSSLPLDGDGVYLPYSGGNSPLDPKNKSSVRTYPYPFEI